jgi:signal transduction histidine kinase
MLGQVLETLQYQVDQATASVQIDEHLPACLADEAHLNQVFTNLIDNALKYRHPQREPLIRICGRLDDRQAVYTVADNGVGIQSEYHDKIFEVFHRLDPKDDNHGEGLGLTIVKRILERMDGTISLESQSDGGAVFTVRLPQA